MALSKASLVVLTWFVAALGTATMLSSSCSSVDAPSAEPCDEINESIDKVLCTNTIANIEEYVSLSLVTAQGRVAKYLSPAKAGVAISEPTFIATQQVQLHLDFLRMALPDVYGALQNSEYSEVFFDRGREYYSGSIRFGSDGKWSFSILEDAGNPDSHVTKEIAVSQWMEISERLPTETLYFLPLNERQIEASRSWTNLSFDVLYNDAAYEVYHQATGCGYLRFVKHAELPSMFENGEISFRDILVIDSPPADIERVVSGIFTEVPQGPLSHLAVRSAARGIPNAYIRDAQEELSLYEDEVVCIDATSDGYEIMKVTLDAAELFWDDLRPEPVELAEPDITTMAIPSLETLVTDTALARRDAIRAYGAKGTNLATLYQRIEQHDSYRGLLIPAHYYHRFMTQVGWMVDLGDGLAYHTFEATIASWLGSEEIASNSAMLRAKLATLRSAMESSSVPEDIVSSVNDAIVDIYGTDAQMLRFRSSSNAEDALGFSGAGLYDSTSVCPADGTDDNETGPSHCDLDTSGERSIGRGLKRVWASVWKMSAFDERAWYGIDHSKVVMGVLINDRAKDERANIVAFSRNPIGDDDDRLLLTAQHGEFDLVSPTPGVRPEVLLLSRGDNMMIDGIERVKNSTVGEGRVLDDSQARSIGDALLGLEGVFPIDESPPPGRQVLLDTEWKILSNNQLVIKQIRPYLR